LCSDVRPDGWSRVKPFQIFEFQLHGCSEGRHREREREREREGGGEEVREGEGGREGGRERERVESSTPQEDAKAASSATERGNRAEL